MSVIGFKEKTAHEVLENVAHEVDGIEHMIVIYTKKKDEEEGFVYYSATPLPAYKISFFAQFMNWLSLERFRNGEIG